MHQDLLHRFCEESADTLRLFSTHVLALETAAAAQPDYAEMMRILHSLKGSSRMLGLIPFGNALHAAEDVLSTLDRQQARATPDVVDALLKTSDTLQSALTDPLDAGVEQILDHIAAELSLLQESLTADPAALMSFLSTHAPELFRVLNSQQQILLYQEYMRHENLIEISVSLAQESFLADVDAMQSVLKDDGILISTSGSRSAPAPGFDLRFSFLHLTNSPLEVLTQLLRDYEVALHLLPRFSREPDASSTSAPTIPTPVETSVEKVEMPARDVAPLPALISKLEFDSEFRELQQWFLDEGEESLRALSRDIIALEENHSHEMVNAIFRVFHNLKGSGGSYKFPVISRLAHCLESYVDLVRRNQQSITAPTIDAMLRGVDLLARVFVDCKRGIAEQLDADALEAELTEYLTSTTAPAAPPLSVEQPRNLEERDTAAPTQPLQERRAPDNVRIANEKIERIINGAVELAIAHHAEEALLHRFEAHHASAAQLARAWRSTICALDGKEGSLPAAISAILSEHAIQLAQYGEEYEALLHAYEKSFSRRSMLSRQVRDEVLDVQLLPLDILFESLQRINRDLSRSLGKPIHLTIDGVNVEVDRRIIEALKDPLVHLIRNAIDHGIESADERRRLGKPSEGSLRVSAQSLGYSFSLTIQDDGRGLDRKSIGDAAIRRGITTPERLAEMSDDEVFRFIFAPGFTTRTEVTDVSGRGVGMDVVMTNLKQIGGEIFIDSTAGHGTTFRLVLPCSLVLSKVLLIPVEGRMYSLPTGSVESIVLIRPQAVVMYEEKRSLPYDGDYLPIIDIESMLHIESERSMLRHGIVLARGGKKICLSVPRVLAQEELMTRPLPTFLRHVTLFSGANVLSDGTIAFFINPSAISLGAATEQQNGAATHRFRKRRLLVVDDSFISRELLKNILVTTGYDVVTASDGAEALTTIESTRVDLVVSDVDMPRMNGLQLTRAIKANDATAATPVIIVSAREDENIKLDGLHAGANAYIVKGNFNQQNLLSAIERLLPEAA